MNNGKVTRVEDGEVEEVLDDIFVALYNDGTLVFSNSETEIDSSKVLQNYGNIKNTIFSEENETMWCQNENITKVNILTPILPTNTAGWFAGLYNLTDIENIENIDTSNVTDMSAMFSICASLTTLDLSNFDTSNVTNMSAMFSTCTNLRKLDLSNFDTSNVTNMSCMFNMIDDFGNSLLEKIYVSDKWTTEYLNNDENMFYNCDSLVGECGTEFSETWETSSEYAVIDRGEGYLWAYVCSWEGKSLNDVASYDESSSTWTFKDESITFEGWNEQGKWLNFTYYNTWYYMEFNDNKMIELVIRD